jgi:hypothetical protein
MEVVKKTSTYLFSVFAQQEVIGRKIVREIEDIPIIF